MHFGLFLPKLLLFEPFGSGFLYAYCKDGERTWSTSIDELIAVCRIFPEALETFSFYKKPLF